MERVERPPASTWDQMRVGVDRQLDRSVAELRLNIGGADTARNQNRGIAVSKVMHSDATQTSLLQYPHSDLHREWRTAGLVNDPVEHKALPIGSDGVSTKKWHGSRTELEERAWRTLYLHSISLPSGA